MTHHSNLILSCLAGLQAAIILQVAAALRNPTGCPAVPEFTCQLVSSASSDHLHLYFRFCSKVI